MAGFLLLVGIDMYIEDRILNAIMQHAEREFPNECCGVVINDSGVLQYIESVNLSPYPDNSFVLNPVLLAQHNSRIELIVHSHPNRSAKPSEADMAGCERCKIPYLIVSYPAGDIQCYRPKGYRPNLSGRPFVYGVFDCFALVRDYYAYELNIMLPDRERPAYGWWQSHDESCLIADYKKWGFEKVDDLRPGDVIVMQLQAVVPNHVAVYLGDGIILHHTLNGLSGHEQYGNYWRKNTICYLRHNERD